MVVNQTIWRNGAIAVIWLGFIAYVLWLAPLDQPETGAIVFNLLTLQLSNVNAYLFAIFWLMGVMPMIFACLMFADATTQKLPALPWFLAANGAGILGLTPYLLWRERNQIVTPQKGYWLSLLDSHKMGIGLSGVTFGLIAWALLFGDWQEFVNEWQHVPFTHLITLDFLGMNLFLPLSPLLNDDLLRRGLKDRWIFWAIALLPLVGPLAYLCLRPPLEIHNQA